MKIKVDLFYTNWNAILENQDLQLRGLFSRSCNRPHLRDRLEDGYTLGPPIEHTPGRTGPELLPTAL